MHKRVFGFSAHFFINHLPDLPSGALNRDSPARQMNPGNGAMLAQVIDGKSLFVGSNIPTRQLCGKG